MTDPKTLLDGFGEATEQVVALRAEVERLTVHVRRLLHDRTGDAAALGQRDTEIERLRAEVEQRASQEIRLFDEIERLQRDRNIWETRARTAEGRLDPR